MTIRKSTIERFKEFAFELKRDHQAISPTEICDKFKFNHTILGAMRDLHYITRITPHNIIVNYEQLNFCDCCKIISLSSDIQKTYKKFPQGSKIRNK